MLSCQIWQEDDPLTCRTSRHEISHFGSIALDYTSIVKPPTIFVLLPSLSRLCIVLMLPWASFEHLAEQPQPAHLLTFCTHPRIRPHSHCRLHFLALPLGTMRITIGALSLLWFWDLAHTSSRASSAWTALEAATQRVARVGIHLTRLNTTAASAHQHHAKLPNLEIFIVDWHMTVTTFGAVADALATFAAKSLRTLHVVMHSSALLKVIWALDSLRCVSAVYVKLEEDAKETHLGAASHIRLRLPALQHLALDGHIQDFVEQAAGWSLPALRHISINCGTRRVDLPDTLPFLATHGAALSALDLCAVPALPLAASSRSAPRSPPSPSTPTGGSSPPTTTTTKTPHRRSRMTASRASGCTASQAEPLAVRVVASLNDRTLDTLPALLSALDKANGPTTGERMGRWERWWEACTRAGMRLEDCTGALLGELPQYEPPSESGGEGGSEDDEDEDGDREWRRTIPPQGATQLDELRKLLDECRAMDAGRDENYLFRNAMFPGCLSRRAV
ncbi:hypothetical protein C8R45DRAFT_1211936 [Mycena sanguinolenta]|nr:hypothetical protein C8R45DRAFT_1211936 [Mycena sanguinolenta]